MTPVFRNTHFHFHQQRQMPHRWPGWNPALHNPKARGSGTHVRGLDVGRSSSISTSVVKRTTDGRDGTRPSITRPAASNDPLVARTKSSLPQANSSIPLRRKVRIGNTLAGIQLADKVQVIGGELYAICFQVAFQVQPFGRRRNHCYAL